jgi:hypothetical protein
VGIFDRLEDVIRSYLNSEDGRIFGRPRGGDPDIEEAEAELERFLRGEEPRAKTGDWGGGRRNPGGAWTGNPGDWQDSRAGARQNGGAGGGQDSRTGARQNGGAGGGRRQAPGGPPESLRPDFEELGLPFGAGAGDCKAAYRRLLKLHHPDRHAGHRGNMEKATKKMAKINAAYDRIEKWRTGKD